MESALKGLMISAGIILTCIVIGVGFLVARQASATAMASAYQLSDIRKGIEENTYTKYDGVDVTGSDVVNFTKRILGSYEEEETCATYVRIETSTHKETYWNKRYLKDLRDLTKQRYVNPLKTYQGEVKRDLNQVVIGVVFIEK